LSGRRPKHWIDVKNRKHLAFARLLEAHRQKSGPEASLSKKSDAQIQAVCLDRDQRHKQTDTAKNKDGFQRFNVDVYFG